MIASKSEVQILVLIISLQEVVYEEIESEADDVTVTYTNPVSVNFSKYLYNSNGYLFIAGG